MTRSLSAGAGWDVIIVVETPAVPGTIVNQAAVQSDSLDGNLENNTAVSSTDILILNHFFLPLITVP